jgi:hypothetical protein
MPINRSRWQGDGSQLNILLKHDKLLGFSQSLNLVVDALHIIRRDLQSPLWLVARHDGGMKAISQQWQRLDSNRPALNQRWFRSTGGAAGVCDGACCVPLAPDGTGCVTLLS